MGPIKGSARQPSNAWGRTFPLICSGSLGPRRRSLHRKARQSCRLSMHTVPQNYSGPFQADFPASRPRVTPRFGSREGGNTRARIRISPPFLPDRALAITCSSTRRRPRYRGGGFSGGAPADAPGSEVVRRHAHEGGEGGVEVERRGPARRHGPRARLGAKRAIPRRRSYHVIPRRCYHGYRPGQRRPCRVHAGTRVPATRGAGPRRGLDGQGWVACGWWQGGRPRRDQSKRGEATTAGHGPGGGGGPAAGRDGRGPAPRSGADAPHLGRDAPVNAGFGGGSGTASREVVGLKRDSWLPTRMAPKR